MRAKKKVDDNDQIVAKLLSALQRAGVNTYSFSRISQLQPVKTLMNGSSDLQMAFVLKAIDVIAAYGKKLSPPSDRSAYDYIYVLSKPGFPRNTLILLPQLFRRALPFTAKNLAYMVGRTADLKILSVWSLPYLDSLVSSVPKHLSGSAPTADLRRALQRFRDGLSWSHNAPEQKIVLKIRRLLEGENHIPLESGEAWSDRAMADLGAMPAKRRYAWVALLNHCLISSGGQPGAKWLEIAESLVGRVGRVGFEKCLLTWFPLIEKPRTQPIGNPHGTNADPNWLIMESHADIIKGLVWLAGLNESRNMARNFTALALTAYKKLPGIGPRAVKIGNACIYALGEMPGDSAVGHLAILKVKVRFRTALKRIEASLERSARRLGVLAAELEEMSVPTYGLGPDGVLQESIGDYNVELRVSAARVAEVAWKSPKGDILKSVPASAKQKFRDEITELRDTTKDIQAMLSAQRNRLDNLFISEKSWPYALWRERYLDHPLMGSLVRPLIWRIAMSKDTAVDAMFVNGKWLDVQGKGLEIPKSNPLVSLWHPIDHSVDNIVAWRRFLETHGIRQPFKQAHREVYLLTDAERATRVYSNRFAGHVVKQHQFNSLCAVRGWRNVLKLLVDQDFPPASLSLPKWNMRVEFWTNGAGVDYNVDTNEVGAFLRLTTDQVRFLPIESPLTTAHAGHRGQPQTVDPIPLGDIPPLVFSEVMRDGDLFVGVSSVGNDPTWFDGGPGGRYRDYWQSYSFGDLSASANTRKGILQGLIPRLNLADRCSFDDKFLVVRGNIRTYKIHLGSSNILMSPNDQYLCIVQSRSALPSNEKLFLPFEGDTTLSVILSKALLLAEDSKISDPSIVNQIRLD